MFPHFGPGAELFHFADLFHDAVVGELALGLRPGLLGALPARQLAKGRRYAVLAIVVVAAFLTPPDVLSQIGLSIPLYLLYEISIIACRRIEKKAAAHA